MQITWWKGFLFIVGIVAIGLIIWNCTTFSEIFPKYEGPFNFLVQCLLGGIALLALFANFNMLQANNDMAAAAKAEIEILKSQHDYAIAPILKFEAPYTLFIPNTNDGTTTSLLHIANITPNRPLKVTLFAKFLSECYTSIPSTIFMQDKSVPLRFNSSKPVSQVFEEEYTNYLHTMSSINQKFIDFFNNNDNGVFAIYLDIEGKIHGTALTCEHVMFHFDGTPVAKDEDICLNERYLDRYKPIDQQFFIVDSSIAHGTAVGMSKPTT